MYILQSKIGDGEHLISNSPLQLLPQADKHSSRGTLKCPVAIPLAPLLLLQSGSGPPTLSLLIHGPYCLALRPDLSR